ncbi:MAG: hypothetical protein LBC07_04215 [Elusimicrobiota bacterium]|jgi:hypothetical protein|nr:hypothetical protein [Elusimicrobiota bacterium]
MAFLSKLIRTSAFKRTIISIVLGFIITLLCINLELPRRADIKNIFNAQTIISGLNIGQMGNEIIFESADKKVEIENNAQWFKNAEGQIGSVVIIKDVGSKWKQKTLQAKIIGDGNLEIKLSGLYENFSDDPVIFVSYQNFKIDGKELFEGVKEGRNDKDELIFKIPVKNGQELEISFEYKNGVTFYTIVSQNAAFLNLWLILFIFVFLILKIMRK